VPVPGVAVLQQQDCNVEIGGICCRMAIQLQFLDLRWN